jgi:hypothetical protein
VELLCFAAQGADAVIEVEWQTGTEFDTWGFYLLRSEVLDGTLEPISEFVPHCDDSGLVGGYYLFHDYDVSNGQTYYYRLQEVIDASTSVYYPPLNEAPISAVAGLPTATPTSTPSVTPTPSSTPMPTATEDQGGGSEPTLDSGASSSPLALPTPANASLGSTFTPTPTEEPTSTNTPMPTATEPVVATPTRKENGVEPQPPSSSDSPDPALQSNLPTPGYPLSAVTDEPALEAYPAPLGQPSATPLPDGYEPPSRGKLPQLATMTPGPYPLSGLIASDSSPRPLLCLGFLLSLLILIAALLVMSRHGRRDEMTTPANEEYADVESDHADGAQ